MFVDDTDLIFVHDFRVERVIRGNLRERIIFVLNRRVESFGSLLEEFGDGNIFQLGGKRQSVDEHAERVGKFYVTAPA